MRLAEALFSGRIVKNPMHKFTNYRQVYPFKQLLPPALRNEVSRKGEKQNTKVCLQEMSTMLVCLKKHEFDQTRCAKEIEGFMMCNEQHMAALRDEGKAAESTSSPNSGRYPVATVNSFLRKFPQPKVKNTR